MMRWKHESMWAIARLVVLCAVAALLVGCEPPPPPEVTVITEADILAVAEPAMQAEHPQAFEQFKPYVAVPQPAAKVWYIRPSYIPVAHGAPIAIVSDDCRVLKVALKD